MSKTKSVVMTVFISIVIVVLSLMCVVNFDIPFRWFGIYKSYNSVVSVMSYGSDLGGGYSAVYYPEGVISATDYDTQINQFDQELSKAEKEGKIELSAFIAAEKKEYEDKYVALTADGLASAVGQAEDALLYLQNNVACYKTDSEYKVLPSFEENFDEAIKVITKRFDAKNLAFLSVAKVNGYAIRVEIPHSVEDYQTLFTQMGYAGDFEVRPSKGLPLKANGDKKLSDYFTDATSLTSGEEGVVVLNMTSEGQQRIKTMTQGLLEEESAVLDFYVGENKVINLSVGSEAIDQRTLYISGSFTPETAHNMGIVINSCIQTGSVDMGMTVDSVSEFDIGNSKAVLTGVFAAFAALIAVMVVYAIVRYKGLGVVHAFGYLSYLICMLMFIAFLPTMTFSSSSIVALLITSVLTVMSNFYVFENVRKEFSVGKTLDSSIKDGYKASYATLLDTHIVLFAIGLISYFISVGEMIPFMFIFLLGVLMSAIVSLVLTRFYWYCMRGLMHRSVQYKFCGFKREVMDDDED